MVNLTHDFPPHRAQPPPSSIVIVGAGVFGLSTALAILSSPRYDTTSLTIVDSRTPLPAEEAEDRHGISGNTSRRQSEPLPPPHTASNDSSRIIRADYAHAIYAALAAEAQERWREGWGDGGDSEIDDGQGRGEGNGEGKGSRGVGSNGRSADVYRECGLVLVADANADHIGADADAKEGGGVVVEAVLQNGRSQSSPPAQKDFPGHAYVRKSLQNVFDLQARYPPKENAKYPATIDRPDVRSLPTREAIREVMSPAVGDGDFGYVNPYSGFANAGAAVGNVRERIFRLGRRRRMGMKGREVKFVRGEVVGFDVDIGDGDSDSCDGDGEKVVRGVKVRLEEQSTKDESGGPTDAENGENGVEIAVAEAVEAQANGVKGHTSAASSKPDSTITTIPADLTILATGAWTASLVPQSSTTITSTAQSVAYIHLEAHEAEPLLNMPVLLNMTTGMFVIPPIQVPCAREAVGGTAGEGEEMEWVLKVARHAYGFKNPVAVLEDPVRNASSSSSSTTHLADISQPAPRGTPLPDSARDMLRSFLARILPQFADRPFSEERLCWYTDTPEGDFLVDWVPGFERSRSLFVATGGSGHGFKFLPVIGEKILGVLEGDGREEGMEEKGDEESGDGKMLRGLRESWRWKDRKGLGEDWWCEDDSRGGKRGLKL
ncbi:hypothetical protein MMC25_001132 [Agyrium rufum]|nr:hypothetical protein [Agyrium rufum]